MAVTNLLWLPAALRAAGLTVVEYDGWKTRSHGSFAPLRAVVWHHDASAKGDSPGVPAYMIRNWNVAGAPLWVDRAGRWHIIGSGVAWHAGAVLPGKPGNFTSVGIETDHTTGEDWPDALLASLRTGTRIILRHIGVSPDAGLHFHKTICSPPGRKPDPDGLDLGDERQRVAGAEPRVYELGERVLGFGDQGRDVAALQRRLGIDDDGDFGPKTDAAVEAFQRKHGLEPDGIVGPKTLAALLEATVKPEPGVTPTPVAPPADTQPPAPKPTPKATPNFLPYGFPYKDGHYLGQASASAYCHSGFYPADAAHVKVWQAGAKKRGYTISVDGAFGPQSEKVARAIQKKAGLGVDGKVGPATWKATDTAAL